jgi:hypothetical protein
MPRPQRSPSPMVAAARLLAGATTAFLLAAYPVRAQAPAAAPAPRDSALRAELLRMGEVDQRVREGFGAAMAANDTLYLKRMLATDSANTRRLREIVRVHGWPTRALVGHDGSAAAFLIVQHSPERDFRREVLPLLWEQVRAGEPWARELAMLTDKTRLDEGRPQLYGSSFSLRDGKLVADSIEDPAGLERRRREVGLPTMEEYAKVLEQVYGFPVVRPTPPRAP